MTTVSGCDNSRRSRVGCLTLCMVKEEGIHDHALLAGIGLGLVTECLPSRRPLLGRIMNMRYHTIARRLRSKECVSSKVS